MAALQQHVALLSRRHPTSRDQGNIEGFFKAREAITLWVSAL